MKSFKYSHKSPEGKVVKRLTRRNRRRLRNTLEGYDQTSWHACVVTQAVAPTTATGHTHTADVFITAEFDDARDLRFIVDFMATLGNAKCPPESARIGVRGELVILPCGRRLRQLVRIPVDLIANKYQEHRCHPFVAAYLRALDAVSVYHIEYLTGPREKVVAEFAHVLQRMHAEVHTAEMRRLTNNFERNARKCYRSTMDMVHAAVSRHAKLLSIRMDLSYRSANPFLEMAHFTGEEAQAHLATFLDHVRHKTGLAIIGYCWAIEYAPTAGRHFHIWLLLNGHHHQDAAAIGHQLGAVWSAEMTDGQGRYYLCNLDKKRYAHLAVGMLHRASIDWVGVHHIARYITKVDHFLQYQPGGGIRTFGRSCVKRR